MSLREELKRKGHPLGSYLVRVSRDEMEVYLEGPREPSPEEWAEIKKELSSWGLVGILEKPEVEKDRVVVARGKPALPGEDGRLEFLIDLTQGPRNRDEHAVDLREVNALISVKAGTPILRKIPPKPGHPGFNVWGEVLSPPPVKEAAFNYGEGLAPDEKNELLIARISGCLIEKQGRLTLTPTYVVEGDVDFGVGNIRFYGEKLVVTGSVRRGFKVQVEGQLEIQGGVEDETQISVTGDLILKGLLHGESAQVEVLGKAWMRAIEYAQVRVHGDLEVEEYILQARVQVEGRLKVRGDPGLIAAGETEVGQEAQVKVLGNDSYVCTWVKVGHPPAIFKEIEELNQERLLLDETTEKLRKALQLGLKLQKEGRLSPEKAQILKKVQGLFREKMLAQASIQEKLQEKETALKEYLKYTLQVEKKVYPGVRVAIGPYEYQVRQLLEGPGEFALEEGRIKFKPLTSGEEGS